MAPAAPSTSPAGPSGLYRVEYEDERGPRSISMRFHDRQCAVVEKAGASVESRSYGVVEPESRTIVLTPFDDTLPDPAPPGTFRIISASVPIPRVIQIELYYTLDDARDALAVYHAHDRDELLFTFLRVQESETRWRGSTDGDATAVRAE